jgi:hypothetical protein
MKDFQKENKEMFLLTQNSNQIYFELNFATTKIWWVGVVEFLQLLVQAKFDLDDGICEIEVHLCI